MSATSKTKSGDVSEHVTLQTNDERPVSEIVVEALATAKNVEPTEFETRLYDSFDPDALDRLYRTVNDRDEHARINLTVADYTVTIETEGFVRVCEQSK